MHFNVKFLLLSERLVKDVIHSNLHSISWLYFGKAMNVQLEHHNGGSTGYTSNFRNSVPEGNLFQVEKYILRENISLSVVTDKCQHIVCVN